MQHLVTHCRTPWLYACLLLNLCRVFVANPMQILGQIVQSFVCVGSRAVRFGCCFSCLFVEPGTESESQSVSCFHPWPTFGVPWDLKSGHLGDHVPRGWSAKPFVGMHIRPIISGANGKNGTYKKTCFFGFFRNGWGCSVLGVLGSLWAPFGLLLGPFLRKGHEYSEYSCLGTPFGVPADFARFCKIRRSAWGVLSCSSCGNLPCHFARTHCSSSCVCRLLRTSRA